ncbi:MAG: SDR family oxidoreductase, partial [Sphingomonas sp.]
GITCNTLAVTAIESDMLDQLPRDKIDAIVAALPIPRLATRDDVTHALDFFLSPHSGYITAQTLWLGGIHQ